MAEGQHTSRVAAPRSLEVIRHELREAQRAGHKERVDELLDELSVAADTAEHLKRGLRRGL